MTFNPMSRRRLLQGAGMTAICKGKHASAEDVAMTCHMFDVVGRTVVVDEKHMDAVTALSASGPAYIYIILESLAEAGVKVGLPRDIATLLAAQTTMGAAREARRSPPTPRSSLRCGRAATGS